LGVSPPDWNPGRFTRGAYETRTETRIRIKTRIKARNKAKIKLR
jgi:hypothetical protein